MQQMKQLQWQLLILKLLFNLNNVSGVTKEGNLLKIIWIFNWAVSFLNIITQAHKACTTISNFLTTTYRPNSTCLTHLNSLIEVSSTIGICMNKDIQIWP